jgi:hypothetical protein
VNRREFLSAAALALPSLALAGPAPPPPRNPPRYELTVSGWAAGSKIGPSTTVCTEAEAKLWLCVMAPVGRDEWFATGAVFGPGARWPEMTYRLRVVRGK